MLCIVMFFELNLYLLLLCEVWRESGDDAGVRLEKMLHLFFRIPRKNKQSDVKKVVVFGGSARPSLFVQILASI